METKPWNVSNAPISAEAMKDFADGVEYRALRIKRVAELGMKLAYEAAETEVRCNCISTEGWRVTPHDGLQSVTEALEYLLLTDNLTFHPTNHNWFRVLSL